MSNINFLIVILHMHFRVIVGVPNGTVENGQVENTGYVLQCGFMNSGECSPLTGTGRDVDLRLYDTAGMCDVLLTTYLC